LSPRNLAFGKSPHRHAATRRDKPDGSLLFADGSLLSPDGSLFSPDGSLLFADGSLLSPDGLLYFIGH